MPAAPLATLLAGHRAVSLTILDCGTFSVRGGERVIGIPAYLVQTDHGARVLIDGGFPPGYGVDPVAAATADGLAAFGALINHSPRHQLAGQLALLGLTPDDIDLHVLTHGHIDHVGGLSFCKRLVLTATERADPRPRYFGSVRPVHWPQVETHLIHADAALCQGLTLIPTPGHTPGHLSVRVDLPQTGCILLAADAINRASEPAEGYADAADAALACASGDRLLALQAATGGMLVYGHDPAQWPQLRKAPDGYR